MSEELHSLVAPYALDGLDDAEERSFEEHLALCERCREELAGLREAAASLAYGAPPAVPPPALKGRILAQARSERSNVAPLRRRRNWAGPLAATAAVAAAIAVAVGLATRSSGPNAFTHVLDRPGARVVRMGDGNGALAVAPDGEAALALRVPRAPTGKTYQAWVIQPHAIRSAGVFGGGAKLTIFKLRMRVPKGSVVGVTVERAGGAPQPTQKPFTTSGAT
jgi:anti-sigma-K factor RskA